MAGTMGNREVTMKVYISVDLEGATGVVASHQCTSTIGAPLEVRKLVTGDVNAAIAGAKRGGATAVWVNENHSGRDILCDEVDPLAEVLIGKPKPLMTLEGLDSSFACVFMIGAHAAAGTENAILDHTWSARCIQNVRVNGVRIGETGLNAIVAGHFGVPLALVAGDLATVQEAEALLGDVEGAVVKEGVDRYAARCPHPTVARAKIEEAATRAIKGIRRFKPYKPALPLRLEIDYTNTAFAAAACWIPTAQRIAPRSVAFDQPDGLALMKTFIAAAALPRIVEDPVY
jgi:D-amino peptidase